jgi:hypothetical protein
LEKKEKDKIDSFLKRVEEIENKIEFSFRIRAAGQDESDGSRCLDGQR